MIRYAAIPQTPRPTVAKPGCIKHLISNLADAICEIGGSGLPVTEDELVQRNFSPAFVARYGEKARTEARRRFIRHI